MARGKAVAKREEMLSTTMRPVCSGGKEGEGWARRASRWGRVGVKK